MRASTCTSKRAFTLIEILSVITVIGVLAAIIMAVSVRARIATKRTVSLANLREISAGALLYANDHRGQFPYLASNTQAGGYSGSSWSADYWTTMLRPYLPAPESRWASTSKLAGAWSLSPVLINPFVEDGKHNEFGDYGGNSLIFTRPWGTAPEEKIMLSQFSHPPTTILTIATRNSAGQGSWVLDHGYITGSKSGTTALPYDWAESGQYQCAFADGHAKMIDASALETAEQRISLFTP